MAKRTLNDMASVAIKSSPGKPRIPPRAAVEYEVELVDLPGKGEEFILDDPIDNSSKLDTITFEN
jgi:hypothetical protein